ncbi:MAG: DUF423 domain-containing protein [Bacteroidia bacterium]
MQKKFIQIGSFSGALSIALGAMAAHALKSKLETGLITETNLQTFETAARYQMYHSIVLLVLALLLDKLNLSYAAKAGYCFIIGIILFSGSLYMLSTAKLMGLSSTNWLGPITPIGGLFFIIGWLFLGFSAIKANNFKS